MNAARGMTSGVRPSTQLHTSKTVQRDHDSASQQPPHHDQTAAAACADASRQPADTALPTGLDHAAEQGEHADPGVDAIRMASTDAIALAPSTSVSDLSDVSDAPLRLAAAAVTTAHDATANIPGQPEAKDDDDDRGAFWLWGGGTALAIGAFAALGGEGVDDGGDSSPLSAATPAAGATSTGNHTQVNETSTSTQPLANIAPTSTDGSRVFDADHTTNLSAADFRFSDANPGDTMSTVRIDSISVTPIANTVGAALQYDASTGHGYEIVQSAPGTITWDQARAAAEAKGGHLAILDTSSEMAWIGAHYDLGDAFGDGGYFVGASQAAGQTNIRAGWSWLDGTTLPGNSPLWLQVGVQPDNGFVAEGAAGSENYAAVHNAPIVAGQTRTDMLMDATADGANIEGDDGYVVRGYLIEYDNVSTVLTLNGEAVTAGQEIAASDIANLAWNSLFNTGGTINYSVADNAGAYDAAPNTLTLTEPVGVGPLIDEPGRLA